MKYLVLFSLKNDEKAFKTVVCCSRDWHLKGSVVIVGSSPLSKGLTGKINHIHCSKRTI